MGGKSYRNVNIIRHRLRSIGSQSNLGQEEAEKEQYQTGNRRGKRYMDMLEEDIDAETGEEYQYNPKWDVNPSSEN